MGVCGFRIHWRRPWFQWEVVEFESLVALLSGIQLNPAQFDKVRCSLTTDRSFTIKTFMEKVNYSQYGQTLPPLVADFISRKRAPHRAQLTLWFLARRKLKTGQLLVHLHLLPQSLSVCPWYAQNGEDDTHLLFTCFEVWKVWCAMFR